MPSRIDDTIRRGVAWSFISGDRTEDIAAKHQISYQSCRNIVDELKRGHYPEYHDYLDILKDVRWLLQQLRAKHCTLEQAIGGTILLGALTRLGAEPAELKELLEVLREISPAGFPREEFVKDVLKVSRLEKETGMSYSDLGKTFAGLKLEVSGLETAKAELTKTVKSLQSTREETEQNLESTIKEESLEIERLDQARAKQLAQNRLTEEGLKKHLSTQDKLASRGISVDDLDALHKILDEFEKHGMNAKEIVEYVKRIDGLSQQVQAWNAEAAKVGDQLKSLKGSLEATNAEVVLAKIEHQTLQDRTRAQLDQLAIISQQSQSVSLRNEWAHLFEQLLSDPSATNRQITRVIEKLSLILRARENARGLPIDYKPLRDEFLFLLEQVGGKKLVTREAWEEETRELKRQNMELLFGHLEKEEAARNKLTKDKADLESHKLRFELHEMAFQRDRSAFYNFSEEILLEFALEEIEKGAVRMNTCKSCGTNFAFKLGSKQYCSEPISCPFCQELLSRPLLRRPLKQSGSK